MHLMDDKELMQSVWRAYFDMEFCRLGLSQYYELKLEGTLKEFKSVQAGNPSPIPLYDFFNTPFGILEACKTTSNELKEIVKKLEKY